MHGAMMTVEKKAVTKEMLDGLLADYRKPEDFSKYLKMISSSFADVIRRGNIKP